MIQPVETKKTLPMTLHGGAASTTTEVWEMLGASRNGDLARAEQMISARPELSTCQYNYTPPLHFAIREGHLPLVRLLVDRGALDPGYKSYPFGDSFLTMGQDRGHDEIVSLLQDALANPERTRKWTETGTIDYRQDDEQIRFDKAVHEGNLEETERLLESWLDVTLLHDMAQSGDIGKARLLLDRGADINAVDGEYRSTPLGLAARWGQSAMVSFLLERGADPNKGGAQWATPLAWAKKKGHTILAADLIAAGARHE